MNIDYYTAATHSSQNDGTQDPALSERAIKAVNVGSHINLHRRTGESICFKVRSGAGSSGQLLLHTGD